MVNNESHRRIVAGEYRLARESKEGRTRVRNGPIYHLSAIKALVMEFGLHVVVNAAEDMASKFAEALTKQDVADIIVLGLRNDDVVNHHVESEICKTENGMVIDCDAYRIRWRKDKKCECKSTGLPIYLKFGFRPSNPKCIIVRLHPSTY